MTVKIKGSDKLKVGTLVTGKASVAMKTAEMKEEQHQEKAVGEAIVATPDMGKVGFALGMTLNLGNYESARVDVSIEIPTTLANLEKNFVFAQEWVDTKLVEIRAQIQPEKFKDKE